MRINIIETDEISAMHPLTSTRKLGECPVAGSTLKELIQKRFTQTTAYLKQGILDNFWPSDNIISLLTASKNEIIVKSSDGITLAWSSKTGELPGEADTIIPPDEDSILIHYPWDILAVNEQIIGNIRKNNIAKSAVIRENALIDGYVEVGEGTVILPGVYIEGNAIIGQNCKIGPNCYIRGNTSIGNNCHIGQAVEVKNSLLMNGVSAGHLSYIGDSVIGENTNLGAGTITANFRHDGKNHRSEINGEIIDTGRRKFGCIIGDDVHTGIHTSIYPGRKIWPNMSTLPGEIVTKDIK